MARCDDASVRERGKDEGKSSMSSIKVLFFIFFSLRNPKNEAFYLVKYIIGFCFQNTV